MFTLHSLFHTNFPYFVHKTWHMINLVKLPPKHLSLWIFDITFHIPLGRSITVLAGTYQVWGDEVKYFQIAENTHAKVLQFLFLSLMVGEVLLSCLQVSITCSTYVSTWHTFVRAISWQLLAITVEKHLCMCIFGGLKVCIGILVFLIYAWNLCWEVPLCLHSTFATFLWYVRGSTILQKILG